MNKNIIDTQLFQTLKQLIEERKQYLAYAINAEMSMLYWQVGSKVNEVLIGVQRAEYGKKMVAIVAQKLEVEYGASFSEKNLRRMMQFAAMFPDEQIVVSLIRQLTWTHILAIIPIKDPLKRTFYIQMCIHEKWSVRTFRQ